MDRWGCRGTFWLALCGLLAPLAAHAETDACTLVTALIPKDRICITERATLGFHAGWFENKAGERFTSPAGTRALYQMYPPIIRDWIARQGGLGKRTIVLAGRELAAMYQYCK